MLEINGRVLAKPDYKYHTPLYKDLLAAVVPLRRAYRLEKDISARKEMASTEYGAWNKYQDLRKLEIEALDSKAAEPLEKFEELNETHSHFNHQIPANELVTLREFFDRFKVSTIATSPSSLFQDHQTHRVSYQKLAEFHGEYSKMYTFPVPLHPKNLAQLLHSFQGYLCKMEGNGVTFDELHQIYLNQIAASYEKTFGNDILGEELSCLSFWQLHDSQQKGWMSMQEASKLFKAFKFDDLFLDNSGHDESNLLTAKKLKTEFKFLLQDKRGELLEGDDEMIRFDFVREVFLERGL